METRKLYYEDCHLYHFSAAVTGCERVKKGYAVTLDATAFYPEGGGQACDLGVLGGVKVLDVQEQGEQVVHLCDGPLTVGETVEGFIDENRRFDLMQQHTGEHIVSGIVNRRFGFHNVGFHMGSSLVTIDFDGMIPAEALPEIEAEANRAVWANLRVTCGYPSREELPNIPYRSKKELPWPVRIVEIPGTDICACCGIHVASTGEVGLVKLFSCVKFHQGVRIEMACGRWALDRLNAAYEQNRQVSQAFSAKIMETGKAARTMNERLSAAEYRCAGLEKRIFDGIAQGYEGDTVHFEPGLTPTAVRELADRIASHCGGMAAVFSGAGEDYNLCLVSKNGDVTPWADALRGIGARGGGKAGFFQGSVHAAEETLRTLLKDL